MFFASAVLHTALFTALLGSASAHFQLAYPPPRGPFVEAQEIGFCGSFINKSNHYDLADQTHRRIPDHNH